MKDNDSPMILELPKRKSQHFKNYLKMIIIF